MTIEKLKDHLEDLVVRAYDNQQTSQRIAPGSYGNGYDCGYLKAVQEIWEHIEYGNVP